MESPWDLWGTQLQMLHPPSPLSVQNLCMGVHGSVKVCVSTVLNTENPLEDPAEPHSLGYLLESKRDLVHLVGS